MILFIRGSHLREKIGLLVFPGWNNGGGDSLGRYTRLLPNCMENGYSKENGEGGGEIWERAEVDTVKKDFWEKSFLLAGLQEEKFCTKSANKISSPILGAEFSRERIF